LSTNASACVILGNTNPTMWAQYANLSSDKQSEKIRSINYYASTPQVRRRFYEH